MFDSIPRTAQTLTRHAYVPDDALATSLFLAMRMGMPLFLEGEPGVGKTELAKVLANALDTELIRLQCYEGLDVGQALYEWNYPRQLLAIQSRNASPADATDGVDDLFSEPFLLRRPLLRAIDAANDKPPVLLIDELDRADEEFESFLLELLSDFQVTIPELGTLRAVHRPVTIITSNRTREVHDALKRRCVYHWIAFPTAARELEIVRSKVPDAEAALAAQAVAFVQALRDHELEKKPGVAETIDWITALRHLDRNHIDPATVEATLGFLLKVQDDIDTVRGSVAEGLVVRATAVTE